MLTIGVKINKVAEILKIKNPEIRKNSEESHPCYTQRSYFTSETSELSTATGIMKQIYLCYL